ncbi:SulP family inorganic anion transporter [Paraburkholderia ferrariae]|uniref:SulP family inorganic anion transporter n=1 Tax=Paraburkholderia ferrariae TaxID=386056 RepID=UPI000489F9FA|nr:SulP family inorganic anion transporter [Paraburkholderia ferrariae]
MSLPMSSCRTAARQPFDALRTDLVPAFLLSASSAAEYIGLGVQALASAHGAQAAAIGALVGLMTTVLGLVVVAFGGGTQPLVSGPRIAATVLMSQLVARLVALPAIGGMGLFGVLSCASITVLCAGLTQLVLAGVRGGSIVRMVPASVLSGLLFGSAILAVASQAQVVTRCTLDWPPTLIVVGVGVGMHFAWLACARRFALPRGLSLFAALLGATAAFYVVDARAPAVAACRTFGTVGLDLSMLSRIGALQWPRVFAHLDAALLATLAGFGVVVGLIASLDTLIAAGSVESDSNRRALPNRDLGVHGVANVLAGLAGLLPVVGSLTRSKLAWNAGARTRWVSVFHATMLLLLVVAGTRLLGLLPKLAAAAVMIAMALDMIDEWSRQLARLSFADGVPRRIVASAAWLFLAVVLATVATGQPGEGFGVGCVLALFGLWRKPRALDVTIVPVGQHLCVRVRGALNCFSVDRKLVGPLLARPASDGGSSDVELDLREASHIDASACRSLRQLGAQLDSRGIGLRFKVSAAQGETRAALLAFSVARGDEIVSVV